MHNSLVFGHARFSITKESIEPLWGHDNTKATKLTMKNSMDASKAIAICRNLKHQLEFGRHLYDY